MSIYQYRESLNRRHLSLLSLFFCVIVFFTILLPYLLAWCAVPKASILDVGKVANSSAFTWIFTLNLSFILIGYVSSVSRIDSGGRAVARLANGSQLSKLHMRHPKYNQLNLVVEEICVAANIKKPAIYVAPYKSINAFVAGWHLGDTVLTVHAGALFYLSREELSALVAHEITHLLNEDNKEDMFLLRSTLAFSWIRDLGYHVFTNLKHFDDYVDYGHRIILTGHASVTVGAFLYALGSIFYAFSFIVRSALSKNREFNADAGAVFLTRQDVGMVNVLRKALYQSLRYDLHKGPNVNHLEHFYTLNFNSGWTDMFSTHPPIEKRMARLSKQTFGPLSFPDVDVVTPGELENVFEGEAIIVQRKTETVDWFVSKALETPSQTQSLLSVLIGMPQLQPVLNYQIDESVSSQLSGKKKLQTINRLCNKISGWSDKNKKTLLKKMKDIIREDDVFSYEEYLWYTLIKYRLFPAMSTRQIKPSVSDMAVFLNHINNYTLHEYFPESLESLCETFGLEYEPYDARERVPLGEIETSLRNIQQWSPLLKPSLTVEMVKHIQPHETEAYLWVNTLCSAIDCALPQLDDEDNAHTLNMSLK